MRKNFGVKTWVYPMPVFIVAAYDKEGNPNCMNVPFIILILGLAKRWAMLLPTERS